MPRCLSLPPSILLLYGRTVEKLLLLLQTWTNCCGRLSSPHFSHTTMITSDTFSQRFFATSFGVAEEYLAPLPSSKDCHVHSRSYCVFSSWKARVYPVSIRSCSKWSSAILLLSSRRRRRMSSVEHASLAEVAQLCEYGGRIAFGGRSFWVSRVRRDRRLRMNRRALAEVEAGDIIMYGVLRLREITWGCPSLCKT